MSALAPWRSTERDDGQDHHHHGSEDDPARPTFDRRRLVNQRGEGHEPVPKLVSNALVPMDEERGQQPRHADNQQAGKEAPRTDHPNTLAAMPTAGVCARMPRCPGSTQASRGQLPEAVTISAP